jgi:hypothetical protein
MKQRIILLLLSISLLLLSACSKSEDTLTNLSERELAQDQTLVTGQVTGRVGNDIELAVGTLASVQGPDGADAMPSGDMGDMPADDGGLMPGGGQGGDFSGQTRDSGSFGEGQMPEGGFEDGGSLGETETSEDTAQGAVSSGYGIRLSGESMNLTIPVGTRVLVTSNDVLTASSFGRIQADDILQLIVKTQADGTQTVIEAQIME